jgi:type II secretory pathway pseudopilin PulG
MAMRPRLTFREPRGFSLIELVIYFGLSVVTLGVVVSMFTVAQRTQRQTYSQYLVGGSLSTTIRLIRRELQLTALSSIMNEEGTPGFSCASAFDGDGKFSVNGYGVPDWQKHVYYQLDDTALIRWSKDIPNANLLPSPSATSLGEADGNGRAVMSGLLPAGKAVGEVFEGSAYGGLEINYVRRENGEESLSKTNPRDSQEYDSHTRLVEVTLRTFEDRSEPDFSEITFRVCPRY